MPDKLKNHDANASTALLIEKLIAWVDRLIEDPEFRAFRGRRMTATLYFDDEFEPKYSDDELNFKFDPKTDSHHRLIIEFFQLWESKEMLRQCSYYFRRFPFRGLPISKDDHFRNICEMYFNWFYIVRSRIKSTLNKLNDISNEKSDIGKLLKSYDKEFDQELRARNQVHHHRPFEDIQLDRLKLTRLMGLSPRQGAGWKRQHDAAYRAACREWASRVHRRTAAVEVYLEVVSRAILARATFLDEPIQRQG